MKPGTAKLMSELGTWITALATLAIYSFLYRDNPFYKAAEYLLVGLTVGYSLVISVKTVLWPGLLSPLFLLLPQDDVNNGDMTLHSLQLVHDIFHRGNTRQLGVYISGSSYNFR